MPLDPDKDDEDGDGDNGDGIKDGDGHIFYGKTQGYDPMVRKERLAAKTQATSLCENAASRYCKCGKCLSTPSAGLCRERENVDTTRALDERRNAFFSR